MAAKDDAIQVLGRAFNQRLQAMKDATRTKTNEVQRKIDEYKRGLIDNAVATLTKKLANTPITFDPLSISTYIRIALPADPIKGMGLCVVMDPSKTAAWEKEITQLQVESRTAEAKLQAEYQKLHDDILLLGVTKEVADAIRQFRG